MPLQVNNIWYFHFAFRSGISMQKRDKSFVSGVCGYYFHLTKINTWRLCIFQCTFHNIEVTDMLFCIGPAFG
jgi:hypothetical protein